MLEVYPVRYRQTRLPGRPSPKSMISRACTTYEHQVQEVARGTQGGYWHGLNPSHNLQLALWSCRATSSPDGRMEPQHRGAAAVMTFHEHTGGRESSKSIIRALNGLREHPLASRGANRLASSRAKLGTGTSETEEVTLISS